MATGYPDRVGREEGDGLALLEAVFPDEGGGEVRGVGLDVGVGEVLLGQGVGVAFDLGGGEVV